MRRLEERRGLVSFLTYSNLEGYLVLTGDDEESCETRAGHLVVVVVVVVVGWWDGW